MPPRRAKTKTPKKKSSGRPSRPDARADPEEIIIPPPRQSIEALQCDPPGREPSPEELLALEVSVGREQEREEHLGLAREYPRADRPLVKPLTDALRAVPGLRAVQARVVAQSLQQLADRARDLDEIVGRILNERHSPGEVAELVMAFQRVTEQFSSYTDLLGDKLYEVFDRAKGLK